jgi:acyl-CoA synthetase (AMP-forming)/AMP-acid ligase II
VLNALLREHAAWRPEHPALVHGDRKMTYAELVLAIDRAAVGLRALGVGPDSRVATCLSNTVEHVVLLFAVARVGATVATLDAVATEHELMLTSADFGPEVVFAEDSTAAKMTRALDGSAATLVPLGPVLESTAPGPGAPLEPRSGRYLVQYTSGSTGKPKGVVMSQRALRQRLLDWNRTAGLGPADSHLCILPLSHGYGCYCVSMPALASGGTLHLYDLDRLSPLRVARYVEDHGICCFYALPYFYQLLAQLPRNVAHFARLRLRMVGSAPITEETARAFLERYGARLHNTYGLSEIGIITSNLDPEDGVPLSSIGQLIAGIEAGPLVPEDPGHPDVGELVVRSQGLADGYFSPQDGNVVRDGWLYTGDLVRRDDRGNYVVVGRKTQFINVAGNKVMPGEVEAALQEMPGILESAVVGVADEATGQKVAAFLVTDRVLAEEQVRAHCATRLSSFKVPAYVRFVPALPKSAVGKVQKAKLRIDSR